ncbi:fasciclin domain-containing protein [Pontibacter sp. H249]|uniref:fasciclin domain-containing protein n=1 Tax=Pontibacter sp. H249 TaxID=3133420 RepID=UPI0030C22DC7
MKQRFLKPMIAAAVVSFTMYSCASSDNMSDTTAMDETTTMSETQTMGGETEDMQPETDANMNTDMGMETTITMTNPVEIDAMFEDIADTKQMDVIALAKSTPNLSTFVTLVETAGLANMLSSGGTYTIFAPTNEAFASLSQDKLNMLMKPENKAELLKVLQLHVLSNKVESFQFKDNQRIQVSEDKFINVSVDNSNIMIGGATVVRPDVEASNGTLHVINGVVSTTDDSGIR